MLNTPNRIVEFWVHHDNNDRGLLDTGGYPLARTPPDCDLAPLVKAPIWTSKGAVLAFCRQKKLAVITDTENLIEVASPAETLRFTRVVLPATGK